MSQPPHNGDGEPRPASRELLTAWLLFLLEREAGHGYELRRRLDFLGVNTEVGALYRLLRKLEGDGCVTSSWADSVAGPPRRLYRLTAPGRHRLDELVAAVSSTCDVHAAFLRAHERALS